MTILFTPFVWFSRDSRTELDKKTINVLLLLVHFMTSWRKVKLLTFNKQWCNKLLHLLLFVKLFSKDNIKKYLIQTISQRKDKLIVYNDMTIFELLNSFSKRCIIEKNTITYKVLLCLHNEYNTPGQYSYVHSCQQHTSQFKTSGFITRRKYLWSGVFKP